MYRMTRNLALTRDDAKMLRDVLRAVEPPGWMTETQKLRFRLVCERLEKLYVRMPELTEVEKEMVTEGFPGVIRAIKSVRERTGLDLRGAKGAVDQYRWDTATEGESDVR